MSRKDVKIVARALPGEPETDITGCFDIRIGDEPDLVTITVRDGWVEVRTDGRIAVQPEATNAIRVRAVARSIED